MECLPFSEAQERFLAMESELVEWFPLKKTAPIGDAPCELAAELYEKFQELPHWKDQLQVARRAIACGDENTLVGVMYQDKHLPQYFCFYDKRGGMLLGQWKSLQWTLFQLNTGEQVDSEKKPSLVLLSFVLKHLKYAPEDDVHLHARLGFELLLEGGGH